MDVFNVLFIVCVAFSLWLMPYLQQLQQASNSTEEVFQILKWHDNQTFTAFRMR